MKVEAKSLLGFFSLLIAASFKFCGSIFGFDRTNICQGQFWFGRAYLGVWVVAAV